MILFLPIDIDLSDFDFVQFDDSTKLSSRWNPYWNSTLVSEDTIIKNNFDKVLSQLPFTKVTTLTHKIQQSEVGPHVDVHPTMIFDDGELDHIIKNEPAGYRIVIKGKSDSVEVFNGKEWITAYVPNVPCCYILNSTSGLHRVKHDPDRRILYVRGFLDEEKHKALLQKSYAKYSDYAITHLSGCVEDLQ